MDISTLGGFSFCNKHLKNDKLDILLISVDRDATPDLSNKQQKRLITVTLGIHGKTAIERKQKLRKLLQDWIKQEGPLIFDDDPDLFYKAKLVEKTPVSDLNAYMDSLTLIFEASRNLYSISEKVLTGTSITTQTKGNDTIDTLFKITSNCTVTCGSVSFTLANVTSSVYVDSDRMVVYTLENGKEVNKAIDYTCTSPDYFIRLNPNQAITITSTASIELKYRDTYMV